jgi:hypothetical protein
MRTLIAISVLTIAGYLIYRRVSEYMCPIGEDILRDVHLDCERPYCRGWTSVTDWRRVWN